MSKKQKKKLEDIEVVQTDDATTDDIDNENWEEKEAKLAPLCPMDDLLFGFLGENPKVCEEMLRTILQDDKLTVLARPRTQVEIRSHHDDTKTIKLDAFCKMGNGTLCNVEVQKEKKNIDHVKRTRFHAASMTVSNTPTGDNNFKKVPNVIVVYISSFDVFGKGKTIYRCRRYCEDTGEFLEDGEKIIFVNTKVNDQTEIAYLMQLFKKREINDSKYPALSKQMHYLKHTKGGVIKVCKVMEDYRQEGVDKALWDERLQNMRKFCRNGASLEEAVEYFDHLSRDLVKQLYVAAHQH